jgi:hypothetical protein
MSAGRMQTSDVRSRYHNGRLCRRVSSQVSIDRLADHFQRALFNLDLFGPGCGAIAISSVFLLISFFHQGAHSRAEKGVI